jgi:acyl carrier protein
VRLRPEQIDLDAPLFGTGLGLDSIDAVELVVALESEFGLTLPEEEAGPWRFRTVQSLVELVLERRPA